MGEVAPKFLSPISAATRLDCSRSHIYKLIERGELISVHFGKRMVRIPLASIEQYEDSICKTCGASELTEASLSPKLDADPISAVTNSMRLTKLARKPLSAA